MSDRSLEPPIDAYCPAEWGEWRCHKKPGHEGGHAYRLWIGDEDDE